MTTTYPTTVDTTARLYPPASPGTTPLGSISPGPKHSVLTTDHADAIRALQIELGAGSGSSPPAGLDTTVKNRFGQLGGIGAYGGSMGAAVNTSLCGLTMRCPPSAQGNPGLGVLNLVRFTALTSAATTFGFVTSTAGTSCNWVAGIYNSAGTLLGTPVSSTALVAGVNLGTMSVTGLTVGTDYYMGALLTGSAASNMVGLPTTGALATWWNVWNPSFAGGGGNALACLLSGQSALPSTVTLSSLSTSGMALIPFMFCA